MALCPYAEEPRCGEILRLSTIDRQCIECAGHSNIGRKESEKITSTGIKEAKSVSPSSLPTHHRFQYTRLYDLAEVCLGVFKRNIKVPIIVGTDHVVKFDNIGMALIVITTTRKSSEVHDLSKSVQACDATTTTSDD
jgi:hypothetical protein